MRGGRDRAGVRTMTVDVGYETGGLRRGGSEAAAAGRTAGDAAAILGGLSCPAAAFGQVAGAEALAVGLVRARDAHVALGQQVLAAHVDLAGRVDRTAGAGDGLTADTALLAAALMAQP